MKIYFLHVFILLSYFKIEAQSILYSNKNSNDTLKMEYRNGLPYKGKIKEKEKVLYYEAGNLIRKDSLSKESISLKSSEIYKENKLTEKLLFFFEIFDDPKEYYIGKYKDEKPFNGYFLDENTNKDLQKIPVVSFYENGILKYKYIPDYLNTIDNYITIKLDRKATFSNGKIVEGFEYNNKNRNILVGIGYKNGIPDFMELNLFGMHYFNRFNLELDINQLKFHELRSDVTIKSTSLNGANFTEVVDTNGNLLQSSKSYFVKEGTPNSLTVYAIENGKLVSEFIDGNQLNELSQNSEIKLDNLTLMVYSYLLSNSKQSLETTFFAILNEFRKNEFQKYSDFFSLEESTAGLSNRIGGLYYDGKGNPYEGILINETNGQFEVKAYLNGKLSETKNFKDISLIKLYVEKFNNEY